MAILPRVSVPIAAIVLVRFWHLFSMRAIQRIPFFAGYPFHDVSRCSSGVFHDGLSAIAEGAIYVIALPAALSSG
ncbi:hypothetical protein JVT61DRAFT_12190 [Boletus reticuloceps]|uniref:Uncharacterized protein n=1 Tax=Boletus reticuloceps TaxID=495285 RepID=A0A8I3A3Q1_9AGAM|nr:hypothetical protein JVT61DRAFT_12190 [Boletus reticuloceps]